MSDHLSDTETTENTFILSPKEWLLALIAALIIGGFLCYLFYLAVVPSVSQTSSSVPFPQLISFIDTYTSSPSPKPTLSPPESTNDMPHMPPSTTELIRPSPSSAMDLSLVYEKLLSLPSFVDALYKRDSRQSIHTFLPIHLRVTFYTGLARENGGYEEMNALGYNLKIGSLAAPADIPFGTVFIIDNLPQDVGTDIFIVDDRGGAITRMNANTIKVDVYVPRHAGESDDAYYRRVNNLGVIYTPAKYKLPTT